MARARVPMEKRQLEGTVRAKHKKKAEGTPTIPVVKIVECPDLSAKAKKHWPFIRKLLQALPVSTMADVGAVQRLTECYSEVRHYMEVLAVEDHFYESSTKQGIIIRAHPAVAALAEADRRLRAYLIDFGLTPASRTRVKAEGGDNGYKDPLSEFGI